MNCLLEPVAPYKNFTYPEPLGKLIAEFDQSLTQRRLHRSTPRQFAKALWNFFSRFPTRHDPGRIYVTDVEDYREIRLAQGVAWNTVRKELGYVGTFYNWLRREKCLDIPQPVVWLASQVRLKPLAGEHIQTPPRPAL